MNYRLIAFNGRFIHSCLALFYLRTALEENLPGCKAEIVQYTINDPYYPTLRRIVSGQPAALFFSVYIWNSLYIKRLIVDLLKLLHDRPVILGGPGAGALVQGLQPEDFNRCTLVRGDIEGIAKSFYQDLAGKRLQRQYSCEKAPGFKSPYRPDDFNGPLKNRTVYYESSRGCPFGCTYCLSGSEKGVRHLPTGQVHEEIKAIMRHRPKIIRFVDRTFNDLPERALGIWRFLLEQQGETLFHFEMAPDRFSQEMLRFLAEGKPGIFQFELGIQSMNPKTLDTINRRCNLEKLVSNVRKLVAMDTIHIHLDLILGLPYEDRESFLRSFAGVFKLGAHYIQMGLLKVLPDTPMRSFIEEYGLVFCEKPPYEVLANKWLNEAELEELYWYGECVEAFHNNRFFRGLWDYLRKTDEDVAAFFAALLDLCQGRGFFDLAHTQELMSSLLLELARERSDAELLREILIFDWLRCGHHFVPDHLERRPMSSHRKMLWSQMPQNWEGVYNYKNRDEFFKQSVFFPFSGDFLNETGLSDQNKGAYLCFLKQRENTVFSLNSFLLIPAFLVRS